jgi:hypothetical protein
MLSENKSGTGCFCATSVYVDVIICFKGFYLVYFCHNVISGLCATGVPVFVSVLPEQAFSGYLSLLNNLRILLYSQKNHNEKIFPGEVFPQFS